MRRAYLIYGIAMLGLWSVAAATGWEPFSARRGLIPPNVRQSPGGYRSYNYWSGGK